MLDMDNYRNLLHALSMVSHITGGIGMFFYQFNKNKTVYDLRKSSSYTLAELSDLSGISISELSSHETSRLKDLPIDLKKILTEIFENQLGLI